MKYKRLHATLINEANAPVIRSTSKYSVGGNEIWYLKTTKNRSAIAKFLVVIKPNGYVVIGTKPKKLKSILYNETDEILMRLSSLLRYGNPSELTWFLSNHKTLPVGYFTVEKFSDLNSLYINLVHKKHLSESIFKHLFPDFIPDEISSDDTNAAEFMNAKILFSPGMQQKKKEDGIRLIRLAHKLLKHNKFSYLFDDGEIRFYPTSSGAIGMYYYETNELRVDPTGPMFSWGRAKTIIQELSHKMEHRIFSKQTNDEISLKFQELRKFEPDANKAKNRPKFSVLNKLGASNKRIMDKGTKITYVGNLRKYKNLNIKNIPIKKFERDWKANKEFITLEVPVTVHKGIDVSGKGNFNRITFPAETFFINPRDWVFGRRNLFDIMNHITNEWYVTHYSQSKANEWFAELWSFYILGKLKGGPKTWMDKILKPYKKG